MKYTVAPPFQIGLYWIAFALAIVNSSAIWSQSPLINAEASAPSSSTSNSSAMSSLDYIKLMESANDARATSLGLKSSVGLSVAELQGQVESKVDPRSLPPSTPNTTNGNVAGPNAQPASWPIPNIPAQNLPAQNLPLTNVPPSNVLPPSMTRSSMPTMQSALTGSGIPNAILRNPQASSPNSHWAAIPISTSANVIQPPNRSPMGADYRPPVATVTDKPFQRWYGGLSSVWLQRKGEKGFTESNAGSLGAFGDDFSGQYYLGYMMDPMEAVEFRFGGPFQWQRQLSSSGVVDSKLDTGSLPNAFIYPFFNSIVQDQVQTARLMNFEFNKRWLTDDLSGYSIGFNVIDYSERYTMRSATVDNNLSTLQLKTSNLLAGVRGSIDLWRPFSQRFYLGFNGAGGLYGNFASGSEFIQVPPNVVTDNRQSQFQIAALFQAVGSARYLLSDRIAIQGGYQWFVIPGLATVANQTINPISPNGSYDFQTNATVLFQGAYAAINFNF